MIGLATAPDMEPGMRFDAGGWRPATFVRVEPVVSPFPNKRLVRVFARGVEPFVTDVLVKFVLIGEVGGS